MSLFLPDNIEAASSNLESSEQNINSVEAEVETHDVVTVDTEDEKMDTNEVDVASFESPNTVKPLVIADIATKTSEIVADTPATSESEQKDNKEIPQVESANKVRSDQKTTAGQFDFLHYRKTAIVAYIP